MFDDPSPSKPDLIPGHILDAVAAGLWPSLSTDDRRTKAIEAMGLELIGPFGDRLVYMRAKA